MTNESEMVDRSPVARAHWCMAYVASWMPEWALLFIGPNFGKVAIVCPELVREQLPAAGPAHGAAAALGSLPRIHMSSLGCFHRVFN